MPASCSSFSRKPPPSPNLAQQLRYIIKNTTGGGAGVWQSNQTPARQSRRTDQRAGRAFVHLRGSRAAVPAALSGLPGDHDSRSSKPASDTSTRRSIRSTARSPPRRPRPRTSGRANYLSSLELKNQTAIGNLQAVQVSNEIALAQVQQVQMLRQLVMAADEFAERGGGQSGQRAGTKQSGGAGGLLSSRIPVTPSIRRTTRPHRPSTKQHWPTPEDQEMNTNQSHHPVSSRNRFLRGDLRRLALLPREASGGSKPGYTFRAYSRRHLRPQKQRTATTAALNHRIGRQSLRSWRNSMDPNAIGGQFTAAARLTRRQFSLTRPSSSCALVHRGPCHRHPVHDRPGRRSSLHRAHIQTPA